MAGLLSKERIVAGPGFNRWLVPPAALAIHLSIGQAYAFSVFKLPLTKVIGVSQSAPWRLEADPAGLDLHHCDCVSGTFGRGVRPLVGARRSSQEWSCGRLLLGLGFLHLRHRCVAA